jgi:hypothetical protein
MKSIAVAVMWPAWIWTFAPRVQDRWPTIELKADVNRRNRYENTQTGYRVATSIGGEATGEAGDVIIVDDPTSSKRR